MRIVSYLKSLYKTKDSGIIIIPNSIIKKYNNYRPAKKNKLICLAPFNSIRLNRSGGVTPCCQNYNLDHIQNTSLKEIWFGNQFNSLRKHIKENDLSFFCDFCDVHLRNENYESVLAATYDFHPINANGYPSYIDFSLDNTCNLACIMCNSSLSSQRAEIENFVNDNKFQYDESFYNELKNFIPHLKSVNFSGGEPFLIPGYYKIWDLIFELNPSLPITVTTNGTILNDRVKEYFAKGKFNINLSIDSLNKETYEKIRINARFEKTMGNIDYFKQYCFEKNTTFSFVVCPMSINWKEIPEMIYYADTNNICLNFNIVTKPFNCAIWTMSSKEIATIYEYFKTFTFPNNNQIEINNYKKFVALLSLLKTWLSNAINSEMKMKTYDCNLLRLHLIDIITAKTINYILSLPEENRNSIDKKKLLKNIENVVNKTQDLLLISHLIEKINNLPVDFLFNEFYIQSVDTNRDNLCSLAYYSM